MAEIKKHRHKPRFFLQGRRGPSWRCTVCFERVRNPFAKMDELMKFYRTVISPKV